MKPEEIYLFRMTHIENIAHIVQYGITHAKSENNNPAFVNIGDKSLISKRDGFILSNGEALGKYIPFYFWYRMPMLHVIQNGYNSVTMTGPENIVYCVTTLKHIKDKNLPYLFTDGHATNHFSSLFDPTAIISEKVDFEAVKSKYWVNENDTDLKRRKEAEFLLATDLPFSLIAWFAVYNEEAKSKLLAIGLPESRIIVSPKYYF